MTTVVPNTEHPAKYSPAVLAEFQMIVDAEIRRGKLGQLRPLVLDPMAGVGRIHDLVRCETVGVELEPEWAACRAGTIVGDVHRLPVEWTDRYDLVMVSPDYGNRMADCHNAADPHKACDGAGCRGCKGSGLSPRKTYRSALGRMPSEGSSCVLAWGPAYRNFHHGSLDEMVRVARHGGLIVVNMSDHIRGREVMHVVEWWRQIMADRGLRLTVRPVATQRMKFGQNHEARVDGERIIIGRKPK